MRHHHVLHKKQPKEPFDFVVYFFTIATPLFELPQAISIYSTQDASGVSIWTWAFFCIADIVWITYAVRRKIWPLVFMYACYFIIEVSIVTGILLYS
jgi:uncharacterized protein with PQ loop repeat